MESVDHRQRVLLFLHLFSSTAAVERLIKSSPPEDIADRLCSFWIDDIYVPGIRYRDGLKGDRTADDVNAFDRSFSKHERELLEQFHRFLELRLEMLPKRLPEEQVFPHGAFWQNIMAHARRILEEIDPEGLEMDELIARSTALLREAKTSRQSIGPKADPHEDRNEGQD
jgi:hypothetical protein